MLGFIIVFGGETGDSANRSNRAYASFLLRRDAGFVCKQHAMAVGGAVDAGDLNCSYGPHVLVNVENARKFAMFLCKQSL